MMGKIGAVDRDRTCDLTNDHSVRSNQLSYNSVPFYAGICDICKYVSRKFLNIFFNNVLQICK